MSVFTCFCTGNLNGSPRSFHALDTDGNVHVWGVCWSCLRQAMWLTSLAGTLDGSSGGFSQNSGFSRSSKRAETPLKLKMPAPIRSIR